MSYKGESLQLLSVDYGCLFEELVEETSSMPPHPEDLLLLPFQAIECFMATVMPASGDWTTEAGDVVWDQCGDSLHLYAKVCEY